MSIKFTDAGSIRINTNLPSHAMSVYGVADRHAALSTRQWFAGIYTSLTSTYIVNQGGLSGTPNEDAFINGLSFESGADDIYSVREWGVDSQHFVDVDINELFHFAIIGYMDASQPKLKLAVRKASTAALFTDERNFGGYSWTNSKVHIGAGSGNGNASRMRFSKIAVLDTFATDDATILATMDALAPNMAGIYSYLTGQGADLNAAVQDASVNGNNWTVSGSGVQVDDEHATTDSLVITGSVSMPVASTGEGANVPNSPSGLVASVVDGQTVNLTFTDNSTNETEFVAQVQRLDIDPTLFEPWADVQSSIAGSPSIQVSGLLPGKTYEFRVRAQSAVGPSGYTNVVQVEMPQYYAEALVHESARGLQNCKVSVWRPPLDLLNHVIGDRVALRTGSFEANLVGGKARIRVPIPARVDDYVVSPGDTLEMHVSYRLREADEEQSVICHDAVVVQV